MQQRDRALLVLLHADALVIGLDSIRAQPLERGSIQDHLQPSAVDADFWIWITGKFAARFLVDELAEAIKKAALAILDPALQ